MGSGRTDGPKDTAWMADGSCRSLPPETFFPTDGFGVELAQAVCATCPVREPCLEYAVVNGISEGVWGGASQRQRVQIRRARRQAAAASGSSRAGIAT